MVPSSGWLLIDKPEGISSAKALHPIKSLYRPKKIGHAGTLDPFASGLLMVAFGKATKSIEFAMAKTKRYRFIISWGQSTDSQDKDGNVLATCSKRPNLDDIKAVLPDFVGSIMQMPPQISAKKIAGVRAYAMARAGKTAPLAAQPVCVEELQLLQHHGASSEFHITCSKGFYIRALARDLSCKLGVLGHVSMLRRTHIGNFSVNDAIPLAKIEKILHNAADRVLHDAQISVVSSWPLAISAVLDDILVLQCSVIEAQSLMHGRPIGFISAVHHIAENQLVCICCRNKEVALCRKVGAFLQPVKLFIEENIDVDY